MLVLNIKVEKNYSKEMPAVKASPSHIEQVLINIVMNSVQAMDVNGVLKIKTGLSDDLKDVKMSFSDTGVGIIKEDISKVFEPFFTTKPHGTGLGLSVSYGLIKQHGGEMSVSSPGPGQGATFTVSIPVKGLPNGGNEK